MWDQMSYPLPNFNGAVIKYKSAIALSEVKRGATYCGYGILKRTIADEMWIGMRSIPSACRERFPRHRIQRIQLVSDPSMHHGTCVTRVP